MITAICSWTACWFIVGCVFSIIDDTAKSKDRLAVVVIGAIFAVGQLGVVYLVNSH